MISCFLFSAVVFLGLYINMTYEFYPKMCVQFKKEVDNFEAELKKSGLILYGNFTFQSGKTSDTYLDMRAINSHPNLLRYVVNKWIDQIAIEYDIVCGVATGGMSPAAVLASYLDKPFIYVRSIDKVKTYGLSKTIEGHFKKGDRVIIIDDVLTTGYSLFNAVDLLKNVELNVVGLAVIIDRRPIQEINASRNVLRDHLLYAVTDIDKIMYKLYTAPSQCDAQLSWMFKSNMLLHIHNISVYLYFLYTIVVLYIIYNMLN